MRVSACFELLFVEKKKISLNFAHSYSSKWSWKRRQMDRRELLFKLFLCWQTWCRNHQNVCWHCQRGKAYFHWVSNGKLLQSSLPGSGRREWSQNRSTIEKAFAFPSMHLCVTLVKVMISRFFFQWQFLHIKISSPPLPANASFHYHYFLNCFLTKYILLISKNMFFSASQLKYVADSMQEPCSVWIDFSTCFLCFFIFF